MNGIRKANNSFIYFIIFSIWHDCHNEYWWGKSQTELLAWCINQVGIKTFRKWFTLTNFSNFLPTPSSLVETRRPAFDAQGGLEQQLTTTATSLGDFSTRGTIGFSDLHYWFVVLWVVGLARLDFIQGWGLTFIE